MDGSARMTSENRPMQEQQAFLRALLGQHDDQALLKHLQSGAARQALMRRGLQAYRSNGLALAERSMKAAYPVIAQLLGDDNLAALARQLWRQQPPERGDIACWGGHMADFIEHMPQLVDEPFLGDVARVEWALHQATGAADAARDMPSLHLLAQDDPEQLALTLSPGVFLLNSRYPVASIINAHLLGEPSIAQAGALLRDGVAEQALVWRQGFRPRVCAIDAGTHAMIGALRAGLSLQAALNQALEAAPGFDFQAWLSNALQGELVVGAHRLHVQQEFS